MSAKMRLSIIWVAILAVVALNASSLTSSAEQSLLVPAAPPMGDEFVVSARNNEQYEAAIAYNWKHEEYLVVWQDEAAGTGIYGQRINSRGRLVGPSPIFIAEGGPLPPREPAVAYDPVHDRYLVVWMHDRTGSGGWNLSGRFIPWENSTPSQPEFSITNWVGAVWHPGIAYSRGKQEYLIVSVHYLPGSPPPAPYIAGVRVFADGSGMHPNLLIISSGTEPCDTPDVAYSGTTRNEYLVTWDEWTGSTEDVYAIRLDHNGNPLGSGEFVVPDNPGGADEEYSAVAACNSADQYMVVWETTNWLGHDEIRRRFVSGNGTLDTFDYQVDTTLGKEDLVDVACNDAEQQYLLVWQQKEQYANSKFGILGTRINRFGTVLDVPPFEIVSPSLAPADRVNPAVAAGPAPQWLVAWEHAREGTPHIDIHGRIIGVEIHSTFLPLVVR
jgi:hypothetical protein